MSKFTPGPWVCTKDPNTSHSFNVGPPDDACVAIVTSGPAVLSNPKYGCPVSLGTQGEANARLIAKAPELYAELRRLCKVFDFGDDHTSCRLIAEIDGE